MGSVLCMAEKKQKQKTENFFLYPRAAKIGGTQPESGSHKSLIQVLGHAEKFKPI